MWYSEEGTRRAGAPPSPLLAVPNVIAHPSTASVPTSYYLMWHYTCLDFKGLNCLYDSFKIHDDLDSVTYRNFLLYTTENMLLNDNVSMSVGHLDQITS